MELIDQLARLLDLAEELGLTVRRAPGGGKSDDHPGGSLVRLKGSEVLFLDPTASLGDQIGVVAGALASRVELEDRHLSPQIREILEAARDGQQPSR